MLTLALEQLTTAHLKAIYARREGREHLERALSEGERARGRLWRQACALTLRGLFERRFTSSVLRGAMEACLEPEATGGLERFKGSVKKERARQRALDELAEELWGERGGDVQGAGERGCLGRSYEQLLELALPSLNQRSQAPQHSEREISASYYTPPWMVEQALEVSLQARLSELTEVDELFEFSVLDPACGAGVCLLSSLERLCARLEGLKGEVLTLSERAKVAGSCLYGVDLSPQALELSRLCVLERVLIGSSLSEGSDEVNKRALKELGEALKTHFTCADALLGALDARSFDVVVGNPPYIDSEAMKRAHPQLRKSLSARFKSCKGNWDLFVPFVELSLKLLKPQGALALVTPRQLISADYAAALHRHLLTYRLTHLIDYAGLNAFEGASVSVITLVARALPVTHDHAVKIWEPERPPLKINTPALKVKRVCLQRVLERLPRGHWSVLLSPHDDVEHTLTLLERFAPLSSVAQASDGATTSEAYMIKALICEREELETGDEPYLKLINTGTIDPCQLLWGARELKYLKTRWREPVVSQRAIEALSQRRLTQALTDKVVVAGLSIELEAAVAPSGVLCGKSAKQLIPHEGVCPYALCAYLSSQHTQQLYRALFSARGMGKAISVGSRQLEALPVPPREALSASESETSEAFPSLSTLGKALHADPSNKTLLASLEEVVSACMGFA